MSDQNLLKALQDNIPLVDYLNINKIGINDITRIKDLYLFNKSEKDFESEQVIEEYENILKILACISNMYENSVEFSIKVDMRGLTMFSTKLELKIEIFEELGFADFVIKNSGFCPAFYPSSESFRFSTYLLPTTIQNFMYLLNYFPEGLDFMNIIDAIKKRESYNKKIDANELLNWYNKRIVPTIVSYRMGNGSSTEAESSKSPSINESEQLVNKA